MAKITWLSQKISADALSVPHLAHLTLVQGEMFRWNHRACAIHYNPADSHACERLIHEYGHALLNHAGYSRDIELIAMESAAWQEAIKAAARFSTTIDAELIENRPRHLSRLVACPFAMPSLPSCRPAIQCQQIFLPCLRPFLASKPSQTMPAAPLA